MTNGTLHYQKLILGKIILLCTSSCWKNISSNIHHAKCLGELCQHSFGVWDNNYSVISPHFLSKPYQYNADLQHQITEMNLHLQDSSNQCVIFIKYVQLSSTKSAIDNWLRVGDYWDGQSIYVLVEWRHFLNTLSFTWHHCKVWYCLQS